MRMVDACVVCTAHYPIRVELPDDCDTAEKAEAAIRELLPYIPAEDMEWESDEEICCIEFH